MVFATLAVSDLIGWTAFTVILTTFIAFLARLALSFVIVVVGIYLANFASQLILATRLKQRRSWRCWRASRSSSSQWRWRWTNWASPTTWST